MNMKNATKKLLESYFGKSLMNMDGLFEVLEKTGNTEIALELMLGTYQQPEIPKQSIVRPRYGNEKVTATFLSYDKWEDKVSFNYTVVESIYRYFDNDVDPATITYENIAQLGDLNYSGRQRIERQHPDGKTKVEESSTELYYWLEGAKGL
jgi:hypothetical protein